MSDQHEQTQASPGTNDLLTFLGVAHVDPETANEITERIGAIVLERACGRLFKDLSEEEILGVESMLADAEDPEAALGEIRNAYPSFETYVKESAERVRGDLASVLKRSSAIDS